MGSEKSLLRNEKGVLHVPGGMIGGKIQRLEIVIVILDFRPVRDSEPHGDENGLYFVHRLHHGVLCTAILAPARQREIQDLSPPGARDEG